MSSVSASYGGDSADFSDSVLAPPTTGLGESMGNILLSCLERLLDFGVYKLVFTVLDTPDLAKAVQAPQIV